MAPRSLLLTLGGDAWDGLLLSHRVVTHLQGGPSRHLAPFCKDLWKVHVCIADIGRLIYGSGNGAPLRLPFRPAKNRIVNSSIVACTYGFEFLTTGYLTDGIQLLPRGVDNRYRQ